MSREKLTQKWAVAAFFDDLAVGFEFAQEETPLHATLAGVFAINMRGDEIAELLRQCLSDSHTFAVTGLAEERWGEGLVVTTLADSEDLSGLYGSVQDCLLNKGAVFNEPQYLHDGFTPHVTKQRSGRLAIGASAEITRVSLVDMFPGGNGYRRRIHAVIKLKAHDD